MVEKVQARAGAILSKTLRYPSSAVVQFSVILSEVCQNIIEHAEGPGWVAAQAYNWKQRLGRQVAVIAVADIGRGFRASLAGEHAARFGERWGDVAALEAAFLLGLTRFPDTGRGQGIQQIRKQVARWKDCSRSVAARPESRHARVEQQANGGRGSAAVPRRPDQHHSAGAPRVNRIRPKSVRIDVGALLKEERSRRPAPSWSRVPRAVRHARLSRGVSRGMEVPPSSP